MNPKPTLPHADRTEDLEPLGELERNQLLLALQAVREGDFSARLPCDWTGVDGKIADTFNDVVEANARMERELRRIGELVGKRGRTRQRMSCQYRSGAWGRIEDSVNTLIEDLLWPTAEVTRAIEATARGDLSQTVRLEVEGRPLEGEFLRSATIVNSMIEQMSAFTSEVTRVAHEVGTQGKLGGQAQVSKLSGAWKDLTDNVNSMASHLTAQVRNISEVTVAVASGDLSRKITVDVRGEILQLKEAMNTMVDQLRSFGSEVTRVAREVGSEGKLGGQALVPGVAGTWKDLTDSVNAMASNLTSQVRNIAEVTTAVARGDLSRKITVDVKGEILELKNTINTLVDQLNGFAAEVTRVAREVGSEGKLGGQAQVPGVAGTWKDLTDNVNSMASNLTAQVRNIAAVTTAVARGDLSRKISVDVKGEILELKDTVNTMVDQLNGFAAEVTRVAREVGTEGKLGGQAQVRGAAGTWKDLTDNVNAMASNLTSQVRNIAEVTTAVARGDLSRKITVDVKGEILELKNTINTMVDQLNGFAAEVTRVAREVGTEGKLGGQAQVKGVAGTWKDLTDKVNVMAANLTNQVRGIARVVTAVADGDLGRKLAVEAKGEVAALAETINYMTATLALFADQVTTVAHEVGVEGRLGGQANVPGAAGTWRDLTANVNLLAANLSTQVRAIAEVATAVTQGDLTRSIQIEVRGEVADLRDNINAMIDNLRATTERNTEQAWLKTNLTEFGRMMQGQRDLITVGQRLLSELVPLIRAQQGVMYVIEPDPAGSGEPCLSELASYADVREAQAPRRYRIGESLVGQCARDRQRILLVNVPVGSVRIASGIIASSPRTLIVLPVLFEGQVRAVIELASMGEFTAAHLAFLDQLTGSIGIVFNTIEATMRTEALLESSQQLARELQAQQKELQLTNEELAQKARLLARQNAEVERKNREIEQGRRALEDQAAELALTSRYKSEFLANMSHELRTPLNSILILGEQLADNPEENLSERQVEFARTIHGAGIDLLNLIQDILDLSKIESGTVTVESVELPFGDLRDAVERSFKHEAERRGLEFTTEFAPELGRAIATDPKRLLQVVKNLLSNAFKFTEHGHVRLDVRLASGGWTPGHRVLDRVRDVVALAVSDTGIGIAPERQRTVFEAFQQADAGTARKYGGTGLGLAICRELAGLLGGEIRLQSAVGSGSTFTLFLPLCYQGPASGNGRPAAQALLEPARAAALALPAPAARLLEDDRNGIQPGDSVLLIVEGDPEYARLLLALARRRELKGLVSMRAADALMLARKFRPAAISLELQLPDMLGWTLLSQLKLDHSLRHVPVQVVSLEEQRLEALGRGAFAHVGKPVTMERLEEAFDRLKAFLGPRRRELLLVGKGPGRQAGLFELLGGDDLSVTRRASGASALARLREQGADCIVLDPVLPDRAECDLLEEIQRDPALRELPVVVFAGHGLTEDEELRLSALATTGVLSVAHTPERLLDEAALFLHREVAGMHAEGREMLRRLYQTDEALAGKQVLVVDDDVRNIFGLSSLLERHGLRVLSAATGQEALELVERNPGIALVLMDIMLPEMDGYETTRRLRRARRSRLLPIIALTAKAMKGDRERCLEAGASDYIAKPVNTEQLTALLRRWLHR